MLLLSMGDLSSLYFVFDLLSFSASSMLTYVRLFDFAASYVISFEFLRYTCLFTAELRLVLVFSMDLCPSHIVNRAEESCTETNRRRSDILLSITVATVSID